MVIVNNTTVSLQSVPFFHEGHLMVPIRPILTALNSTINWDYQNKHLTLKNLKHVVDILPTQGIAYVDGTQVNMPVAPTIINGNTFVPVRFIGDSLGYDVYWDNATQTVKYLSQVASNNT